MKVLIVIPAIGSVYGGPSKSVLELAQAVANLGVSVDVVTTNANGEHQLSVPLHTWINEKNYRIQYFSYWGWGDYKISWSLTSWVFQHISDYDVVQTNAIFSIPNWPVYWACSRHRIPYIITPRGMLEPWALSYKSIKKQFVYNLVEKPALNRAGAIQMLASTEAEGAKNLNLKPPIVIIPNGIHLQDFQQHPEPDLFYQEYPDTRHKPLILFLGRIDPKKGIDLLATAFAKARAKFPNIHLIVAGPDNIGFLPTARGYFAEAGCLDAVTFTGMLTGTLKYAALAAASVYVSPSYSEGFSMSVLEGMASGLPCVITTGCNFPEAGVARVAHVVDIDAGQIASGLIDCLQYPDEAKAMGDRAREFIFQKYTWNQIAAQMTAVYNAIINQDFLP